MSKTYVGTEALTQLTALIRADLAQKADTAALEQTQQTAEAARQAAETAQAAAESVQSTADAAQAAAQSAQQTAEAAKTAADAVQSTAETAKTTAETAQSAAEAAQSTAQTAQSAAEAAQGAAQTAQTTADAAQATAQAAQTAAEAAAPAAHASDQTTYGTGNATQYGHVKLSDTTSGDSTAAGGIAATPAAVKSVYDLAQQALDVAMFSLFGSTPPDKILRNNTPEVIQKVAKLGMGANFWSVGDQISIALTGSVEDFDVSGTYYAYIIGFNHNPTAEGEHSIHFQIGKDTAGTEIAFIDNNWGSSSPTEKGFYMDKGSSSDYPPKGWETSYMRKIVLPQFLSTFPQAWQGVISPCTKYTDNQGGSPAYYVTTTSDKIWLLAEYEVGDGRHTANSAEQAHQLPYAYYQNAQTSKTRRSRMSHRETSKECGWWLRSPSKVMAGSDWCMVTGGGYVSCGTGKFSCGISPCFAVA